MPFVSSTGNFGYGRQPPPSGSSVTGLTKTVGGSTYTLIVAHRAFNYPTTPYSFSVCLSRKCQPLTQMF
jgi:hypothetical protein